MEKLGTSIWTAGKPHSKDSIGYSASGVSDIITSQSHDFEKSFYLYLQRGYCYQICAVKVTLS